MFTVTRMYRDKHRENYIKGGSFMSLRTARHRQLHTVKAKRHITFMMIPDPTKSAKVVKVPKWLRFPFYALIIAMSLGIVMTVKHIVDLEYQVASTKFVVLTESASIDNKNALIADLETTNSQHYEKLQTLQLLAIELDEKLHDLQQQKNELDHKINGTEQTTTAQPSEAVVIEAAASIVNLPFEARNFLARYTNEETPIQVDNFDAEISNITEILELNLQSVNKDSEDYVNLSSRLDELIPLWDAYPTGSPLGYTDISSPYGWRSDPINYRMDFHTGIDLEARYAPIYVTGKGVVVEAEYKSGYGQTVVVDHGYGYQTLYAHCSELLVKPGDAVNRGDQVAVSGATGRVTGPHLHYEVIYEGEIQEPLDYIY